MTYAERLEAEIQEMDDRIKEIDAMLEKGYNAKGRKIRAQEEDDLLFEIMRLQHKKSKMKDEAIKARRGSYKLHNQKALNGGGIYTDTPTQSDNPTRHKGNLRGITL